MKQLAFAVVVLAAHALFFYNLSKFVRVAALGRASGLQESWGQRVGSLLKFFFGQRKVMEEKSSLHHLAIYWGFLVLTLATTEMLVGGLLGEWFSSDLLKAALALPALAGTFTGPWSPGNAVNLLRRESLLGPGIVGGGPMLIEALRKAAEAAGVEVRTEAAVERLQIEGGAVTGVSLAEGETLTAAVVAASCHPFHTLCELCPPGSIEYRLEHRIRTFRSRGCVAQVRLALKRPPCLHAEEVEYARTGAHLDDLERAYDAIKYGELPQTPILDIHVPTVAQPELAPEGHAVLTASVYFVPYALASGWDDEARRRLGDRVIEILAQYDAEIPDSVVGREVLTPVDLEARYGIHGGDTHHGEHSLDQLLVRPTPECLHYRTPVRGLFLCGSGSHPGGGLTCAPAELAVDAILSSG